MRSLMVKAASPWAVLSATMPFIPASATNRWNPPTEGVFSASVTTVGISSGGHGKSPTRLCPRGTRPSAPGLRLKMPFLSTQITRLQLSSLTSTASIYVGTAKRFMSSQMLMLGFGWMMKQRLRTSSLTS
eukprot:Lithocolla_globosa_v1_NODE_271_length_4729_cov_185.133291.p5 type:complete len:130 gc:universal NODE_271_length_4729_cov_185.133291:3148-2759(-)